MSVLNNLSSLLEISFPKRPSQNEVSTCAVRCNFNVTQQVQEEQLVAECCICYSYRLDGNTPEIVCDNDQCCQAFHHSCLFEVCTACMHIYICMIRTYTYVILLHLGSSIALM